MAYLFVIGALIFLNVKGYYGKKTSMYVEHIGDTFLFSMLRMLMCMTIGIVLVVIEGSARMLAVQGGMLAICALAGVCNAAFLSCWMLAVRKCAMVTLDVSCTLGAMIPAVMCALLFDEPILPMKLVGFALILVASAILAGYHRETDKRGSAVGMLLVVLAAVSEGTLSLTQQLYRHYYAVGGARVGETVYPKSVYHFYTYVFAALSLLVILLAYELHRHAADTTISWETTVKAWTHATKKTFWYVLIMAVCMFAAMYFQTVATADYGMSSQLLYPLIKGGCLISVNFIAMLFFGERITRRSVCGTLIALAGIVVMNIL